jgi:predicted nucleic acid-binding protein
VIVLDASVWIKILLPDRDEPGTKEAGELWQSLDSGDETIAQPPHWLAEVLAVLSRLTPGAALRDAELLSALQIPVVDHPGVYSEAVRLAVSSQHHLFDTLYHAVALTAKDGVLITADERYFSRMRGFGHISLLGGD